MPGCHVNARIVDAVLKDARLKGKDCSIAFLDVSGAFDNVGHDHVMRVLESRGVSRDLRGIVGALLGSNEVTIRSGLLTTKPIFVKRGVPQGGPLSATLFNLSVDHVYREVCDPALVDEFGYGLLADGGGCVLSGFADDMAVTARSRVSAERVVDLVCRLLLEAGLEVNPVKSTAIILEGGALCSERLHLACGGSIESVAAGERVRYLGCTFEGELVVSEAALEKFYINLVKLMTSSLLKPEQKLNVLNQYVFPSLTYPLQSAPLAKLRPGLLEDLDVAIRRNVKAMLGLPASTATAMFYSPRRFRGLGLLRCSWEAPLQHISIAQWLSRMADTLFQGVFSYEDEVRECAARLCLGDADLTALDVRKARRALREESFQE